MYHDNSKLTQGISFFFISRTEKRMMEGRSRSREIRGHMKSYDWGGRVKDNGL